MSSLVAPAPRHVGHVARSDECSSAFQPRPSHPPHRMGPPCHILALVVRIERPLVEHSTQGQTGAKSMTISNEMSAKPPRAQAKNRRVDISDLSVP